MNNKRTKRLNSLLKEVISEVVRDDVRNPDLPKFITITEVDISKDLRHAKVYISVIGTEKEKEKAIEVLQSASSYISIIASKKVVMRYFPSLIFKIDRTADKQMQIENLLKKIHKEEESRLFHEDEC